VLGSTIQSVVPYLHYSGVRVEEVPPHSRFCPTYTTAESSQGGKSSTIQSVLPYLHYGGFRVEEVPPYSQFCPTYTMADSGWKKFHHTVSSALPTLRQSQEEVQPYSQFCPTYATVEESGWKKFHHTVSSALPTLRWNQHGRSPTIQSVLPYLHYGGVRVEKVPPYSQFCPTYTTTESGWKRLNGMAECYAINDQQRTGNQHAMLQMNI